MVFFRVWNGEIKYVKNIKLSKILSKDLEKGFIEGFSEENEEMEDEEEENVKEKLEFVIWMFNRFL